MRIAQQVGLSLDDIRAALASLPDSRTPTRRDWERLSASWRPQLDARIEMLERLRDRLAGCIGCGCLSLDICPLYNAGDELGRQRPGARLLIDEERAAAAGVGVRRRVPSGAMAMDLVIEVDNEPGALARVAKAVSDAGVNIAAATCLGADERAGAAHPRPPRHGGQARPGAAQLAVTREREVAVVEVDDAPGVLADLAGKVAKAGVNLDLVYVATRNRVVFGATTSPAYTPRRSTTSAVSGNVCALHEFT